MPLTDLKLRTLKPKDKRYKLTDSEGLYIQVETTGSRLWRFKYKFGGKEKLLAFGSYPLVDLLQARKKRDAARLLLLEGRDPSAEKKAVEEAERLVVEAATKPTVPTFREMAAAWLKLKNWSPRYAGQMQRRIDLNLNAYLGDLPIKDIAPRKVLETIQKIEDRDALVMARELLGVARNIFQYAIVNEHLDRDPTVGMTKVLKDPKPVKHHASLKAKELPRFFKRLREAQCEDITRLGLLFTLYTMVRTQETRFLEPEEVDGNMWRIPPERMKMRREHWVPLTPRVQEILAAARRINPRGRPFPFSENRMLYALYDMGYYGKATVHGMRGTASTILNESGLFNSDWIEKQLAHDEEDDVRGAYNAAEYIQHRKKMMRWWSDYLDKADADSKRDAELDELLS
jgi:integrase